MKEGETAHYRTATVLKEIKTVNLGYSGASHGVSIPLPIKVGGFPVRYRVGQSRGHIVKHDELFETSRGDLIVSKPTPIFKAFRGAQAAERAAVENLQFSRLQNGL